MDLYEDQFSDRHDFSNHTKPVKTLIIASTPRSGSHMIGHCLQETGNFGFPLEYVHKPSIERWQSRFHTDSIYDTLSAIQNVRTSDNGVFSIKLHYEHLRVFGSFRNVLSYFPNPHFVFITRKELLRQAVSHSIAEQTGVWIDGQQATNDNEPEYNFERIDRLLKKTIRWNAAWRYLFATTQCKYLEVNFEDIRSDIPSFLNQIAEFMSVEITNNDLHRYSPRTKPQTTNINNAWVERFLNEHNGDELEQFTKPLRFSEKIICKAKKIIGK